MEVNIFNLLAVLVAAWIGGAVARRLNYPAILGELIIGILLGPGILGWLQYTTTINILAEVGIILLMVYIGIEINFGDLKKASWSGLLAAIGGFIVPFILGYYTVIWFDGSPMSALFVAIALGVTSLATKSRILVDLKLLNTRVAYVLMAGALISDTLALLIFTGIISFAEVGSLEFSNIAIVTGKVIGFFVLTISIGIYGLPKLGKYFARHKLRGSTFYFTIILIVGLGYAGLAELAGMHKIIGAFMAGLFIKDNLFPKNISQEVHKAFYDVSIGFLAPIFFVSAGFFVNVNVFQTDPGLLITVVVMAIVGKILGTTLFYLPTGNGWREGLTVGTGMNGRGAVEIIIAGIGLEMGIIDRNIFSILVFMAILTTMTVPILLKWTTNWLKSRGELVQITSRKGYLLIGVNPISLLLAKYLHQNTPICMIDANRDSVNNARANGYKCIHGNALREDIMYEAGAETIETFIGLTRNSEINILASQLARETFNIPNNHIILTRNEDGAGSEQMESYNVTSLFAMRINADAWFSKILDNQYTEQTDIIKEKLEARVWVKNKNANGGDFLPLLIINATKKKRVFHFGEELQPGETVLYLE